MIKFAFMIRFVRGAEGWTVVTGFGAEWSGEEAVVWPFVVWVAASLLDSPYLVCVSKDSTVITVGGGVDTTTGM